MTMTVSVGSHRLALSPNGVIQLDGVSVGAEDWSKIVQVVHNHHVRAGLSSARSRKPMVLVKPAPFWVRLLSGGKIRYLPAGPGLPHTVKQY